MLDEIQAELENAGSSMEKVLQCRVFLTDLKDYAGMNEMFKGRFGAESAGTDHHRRGGRDSGKFAGGDRRNRLHLTNAHVSARRNRPAISAAVARAHVSFTCSVNQSPPPDALALMPADSSRP